MNNQALAALAEKKLEMSTGAMRDFRETHLGLFKQKGLALSHPEAYKFTHLSTFMEGLEYTPYEPSELELQKFKDDRFIDLLFVDGELTFDKMHVAGLKLSSLEETFPLLAPELKESHPLAHLHHSLLSSGVVIEVEKKVKIQKPIRILNLITRSGVNAPTIFVKLNPFAEAVIFEENLDQDVSHALIAETYIQLDTGARLEHVQLNHGGKTSLIHTANQVYVNGDGNYRSVILNLSGKLNRNNLGLELLEPGAHGESYNLYLTHENEHSDINTVIQHRFADTTSAQIAKGILDGESKGVFTGKIHIHPQAQRVASSQLNKNLLLSKKAQAHSQPQLEIFADDVKCSHGSTTGQLSDDEVFYFQARGIPADKAKTLLAHGFGMEIVLKIENKDVRSKVETLVLEALKNKFQLGGVK